jgi:hypothetical protein
MSRKNLKARARASRDGVCFVCQQSMVRMPLVGHGEVAIVTHQGACADRVSAERLIYDRSPRGRLRPKWEVLARLAESR